MHATPPQLPFQSSRLGLRVASEEGRWTRRAPRSRSTARPASTGSFFGGPDEFDEAALFTDVQRQAGGQWRPRQPGHAGTAEPRTGLARERRPSPRVRRTERSPRQRSLVDKLPTWSMAASPFPRELLPGRPLCASRHDSSTGHRRSALDPQALDRRRVAAMPGHHVGCRTPTGVQ